MMPGLNYQRMLHQVIHCPTKVKAIIHSLDEEDAAEEINVIDEDEEMIDVYVYFEKE